MNRHIGFVAAICAPLVIAWVVPAIAAKSPAMEACSAEWAKKKEAKTIPEGQTWPKFWSQCSKEYAAAHGTTTDEATTATTQTRRSQEETYCG